MRRSSPIRRRSRRTQAVYRERRLLVSALLEDRPVCERCHAARSTEVHEVLSRARGGSILDADNCRSLCHACHRWITEHPAEATAAGWLTSTPPAVPPTETAEAVERP